jgi:hypothetical protein
VGERRNCGGKTNVRNQKESNGILGKELAPIWQPVEEISLSEAAGMPDLFVTALWRQ